MMAKMTYEAACATVEGPRFVVVVLERRRTLFDVFAVFVSADQSCKRMQLNVWRLLRKTHTHTHAHRQAHNTHDAQGMMR